MTARNRVTITLDDDTYELLQRLSTHTHMTPASIVMSLLPAHLSELWEYLTWLEQLPPGANAIRNRGSHLLTNYGPDSLVSKMKLIDPEYETTEDRLLKKAKAIKGHQS